MIRVDVDRTLCIGSGMCTSIAPEFFELDDGGALVLLESDVQAEDLARVSDAVACCPVGALYVEAADAAK